MTQDHCPPTWLFLHSSDEWYGADRMLVEFILALPARDRAGVLVWLPDDVPHGDHSLCDELTARGIAWEHRPLPVVRRRDLTFAGLAGLTSRMAGTARDVRRIGPANVVLATSALVGLAPWLPSRRHCRVILHLQELWKGREGRLMAAMAGRVDRIIAISEAVREALPDRLRERTIVVPNGTMAPPDYVPVDAAREAALTFVMAGRWNAWKGHEVLLRAWERADEPGRLVILGGTPPAGAGKDVPGMVAAFGLTGSVAIVGEVDDIAPYIADADVMIVPSTQPEPFGLVSIEAFARGRPVVASDHGGSREIVVPGTGWLVRPGDPDALAHTLRLLDRKQVARAGAEARMRFEREYTIEAFGQRLRAALGQPYPSPRRGRVQAA